MAQATLSTGLARSHLVHVLYRDIPFIPQGTLSTISWSHLVLNIIATGFADCSYKSSTLTACRNRVLAAIIKKT